eukprot:548794-Rhodomonas_salina.3
MPTAGAPIAMFPHPTAGRGGRGLRAPKSNAMTPHRGTKCCALCRDHRDGGFMAFDFAVFLVPRDRQARSDLQGGQCEVCADSVSFSLAFGLWSLVVQEPTMQTFYLKSAAMALVVASAVAFTPATPFLAPLRGSATSFAPQKVNFAAAFQPVALRGFNSRASSISGMKMVESSNIAMPALSSTMKEGKIVQWVKQACLSGSRGFGCVQRKNAGQEAMFAALQEKKGCCKMECSGRHSVHSKQSVCATRTHKRKARGEVGDKIEAGDIVMVVESDKADMDVEVQSAPSAYSLPSPLSCSHLLSPSLASFYPSPLSSLSSCPAHIITHCPPLLNTPFPLALALTLE